MNMTIGQSGDGEEQIAKEEFQRGDLPKTSFEKRAFEFVGTWCRKSREFVSKKIHRWRLLEDLYHNRLDLRSWAARFATPRLGMMRPGLETGGRRTLCCRLPT